MTKQGSEEMEKINKFWSDRLALQELLKRREEQLAWEKYMAEEPQRDAEREAIRKRIEERHAYELSPEYLAEVAPMRAKAAAAAAERKVVDAANEEATMRAVKAERAAAATSASAPAATSASAPAATPAAAQPIVIEEDGNWEGGETTPLPLKLPGSNPKGGKRKTRRRKHKHKNKKSLKRR